MINKMKTSSVSNNTLLINLEIKKKDCNQRTYYFESKHNHTKIFIINTSLKKQKLLSIVM